MIVNIGGFGHTGNTALKDFLVDTDAFVPLAKDYGETAILRGLWGIETFMKIIEGKVSHINPRYFLDVMIGNEKGRPDLDKVPNIHDYRRNARIKNQWNEEYTIPLDSLIASYTKFTMGEIDEKAILDEIRIFFSSLKNIAYKRKKYMLMRNDPAAYSPALINLGLIDKCIFIYRDPVDICYEWVGFYYKNMSQEGVAAFVHQFNEKVKRFSKSISAMKDNEIDNFFLLSFESFVKEKEERLRIINFLKIKNKHKNSVGFQFNPGESMKNIGVGYKELDNDIVDFVSINTKSSYDFLLNF